MITWKTINTNIGDDDCVSVSIQEMVDNVEGDFYTSDRFHKSLGKEVIINNLKKKIEKARMKKNEESNLMKTLDFSVFETSLAK